MEIYFEAMRFVSILLDFRKNKMYTRSFLIRGMHTRDSWL